MGEVGEDAAAATMEALEGGGGKLVGGAAPAGRKEGRCDDGYNRKHRT